MTKKLLAVFLALTMLATLLTGCTGGTPAGTTAGTTAATTKAATTQAATTSAAATTTAAPALYYNEPGTLPIVNEKIKLEILSPTHAGTEDYNTNKLMLYIEEQTNIDINVTTFPLGEFLTKLDLLMAAGGRGTGDVIAMTGTTHLESAAYNAYGAAGFLLDVTPYLDTLAYYMPQAYALTSKSYETAKSEVRAASGETYGAPFFYDGPSGGDYRDYIQIYRPWLEAAGMELPTSLAEYRAYLEYVRDHDMDGDGNPANEIPATSYPASSTNINILAAFATPFMGVSGHIEYYIDKADNSIAYTYDKESYREALYYIKALVDDGLLDPNSFTQDKASHDAMTNLDPNILGSFLRFTNSVTDLNRRNDWVVTTSLANEDGVRINAMKKTNATARWFITTNCKYPEAAFLLGDYLTSPEIAVTSRRGWEGEDWVWANDYTGDKTNLISLQGYDLKDCYVANLIDYGGINNVMLTAWGASINGSIGGKLNPIFAAECNDATVADIDWRISTAKADLQAAQNTTVATTIALLTFTPEEQEILTECWTPIKSYMEECYVRFCLSDMSLDKDWDTYLSTLEAMGLSRVVDVWNACYDRMK